MEAAAPPSIHDTDLHGWKYFRRLTPLLQRLHDAGCQRDKAGNRSLHFDQYCTLILLALFSPLARSLRALSQASGLQKVQQQLGVRRAALGSLSEAARTFDPDLLLPLVAALAGDLQPLAQNPQLKEIRHLVTAVDSTLVKTLPCLAEAVWSKTKDGQATQYWRLHTHFAIDRHVPIRIDATAPNSRDGNDEKDVLRQNLQFAPFPLPPLPRCHLDQVDAVHAGGLAVLKQPFRRERPRFAVLLLVALGQRVVGGVRRPDVNVPVDETDAALRVRRLASPALSAPGYDTASPEGLPSVRAGVGCRARP